MNPEQPLKSTDFMTKASENMEMQTSGNVLQKFSIICL